MTAGPLGRVPTRPWRRRAAVGILGGLTVAFAVATARLFVFPHQDAPAPVDAIVMFAGSPGRLERAVALARAGYAPVLAVSAPTEKDPCPGPIPGVEVICFSPDPRTTQGESRWTSAAAARRGWHSLIVVASTSQSTRARLRLARCYDGETRMQGVPPPRRAWPYVIAYEWAALGKALVLQRHC
ncbi:hypothetical protein CcI156_07460 [Frankia sp. CcI156]|nr:MULTISPECIES: hypothetical protein [Frankia]ETA03810.1 hypothetical protein CcI6DRAFT_00645 [Frankia sp. CcI6]EYT93839.1 hypothetical protein ThrDRAFT_00591 [Frankia casuarinae]KDA44483.1 hypothetical protein BMG523Draft_00659 [Frankia sp. BMG5.23]KEZ37148.1 hypothetical protein CEDDRAFT_01400 [Frankia sp. CeD]KFB04388.1 hypothetical protein ALLO2DRAFT_02839 [Frankia sp. Allo2]